MTYRSDIDGLRAVAVLAVLAFHFGTYLPGGFIGVDIFFVISGYLIAKNISTSVEAGTFAFTAFYARRARRLLPALYATLIPSFGAAFLLMTPEHFKNFGLSAAAAATSVSNLYFWQHSSYFDVGAHYQPLLHTWSLSVEEQFYLLFPAAFAFALWIKKKWVAPALIGCGGLISLLLSISFQDGYSVLVAWSPWLSDLTKDGPTAIFYFPLFRAFEFAIGIGLLWIPAASKRTSDIALVLGLFLIGYSAFTYTNEMLFPAANALPPCIGAALCIYGGRAPIAGIALSNPISVFVGKISYSVYLVHWPLLIFYRYYAFRDPSTSEYMGLFVASISLGYVSYRFIETPFRNPRVRAPNKIVLIAYASFAANIALAGYVLWSESGWPWRISPEAQLLATAKSDLVRTVGSIGCKDFCEFGDLTNPNIVIVAGDSHSDQYTKALSIMAPDIHFKLIQSPSCFMGKNLTVKVTGAMYQRCISAEEEMRKWIKNPNIVAVIQAQRWVGYINLLQTLNGQPEDFKDLPTQYSVLIKDAIDLYKDFPGKVLFVNAVPNTNLTCLSRPVYLPLGCPIPPLEQYALFTKMMRQSIGENPRFSVLDPADILCSGSECKISVDGVPTYSDHIHLSLEGAKLIVPEMLHMLDLMSSAKTSQGATPTKS